MSPRTTHPIFKRSDELSEINSSGDGDSDPTFDLTQDATHSLLKQDSDQHRKSDSSNMTNGAAAHFGLGGSQSIAHV